MPNITKIINSVANKIQSFTASAQKAVTSNTVVPSDKLKISDIPSSAVKATFMPVENLEDKIIKKVNFRTQTGEIKEAIVTFTQKGINQESVTIKCDGSTIANGFISTDYLSHFDKEYLDLEIGIPGEIKKIGNCIFIDRMHSWEKGAGTLFHKAVAQRSIDLGCNGRVALDAAWSSHPFHLKSGFVPLFDDEKSRFIVETIKEKLAKAGGERINTDWVGSLAMILSPENAQNLLSRPL